MKTSYLLKYLYVTYYVIITLLTTLVALNKSQLSKLVNTANELSEIFIPQKLQLNTSSVAMSK
ncbi:MAG: hypothetical protein RLZZ175_1054 [Bacteroidota bacterium]|jgi:hypothetical protein